MHDMTLLLLCMAIPMYSYPFHFLFDRGNMDGFTLLLLSIGMYFLAAQTKTRDLAAGFFFAAAISFKAYPALVVLPLLATRRYRAFAALAATMACFILASPSLWMEWFEWILQQRTAWFNFRANGSLANTFFFAGEFFGYGERLKAAAVYAWGALLLTMFALDLARKPLGGDYSDRGGIAALVLYIPFMLAVPQLAWHYELVCVLVMLPAVSYLWINAVHPSEKRILALMTIGLILTQFHAFAVEDLLNKAWGSGVCERAWLSSGACVANWVPGLGLFLVMLCAVAYKVLTIWFGRGYARASIGIETGNSND